MRGKRDTRTYRSWRHMIDRCTNPRSDAWNHYGGRGISVCERWLTFANFLADMGERPADKTLDRRDNDGPYEPENCRWVTYKAQRQNTRNAISVTHNQETKALTDWARHLGISYNTLFSRYRHGPRPPALFAPPMK